MLKKDVDDMVLAMVHSSMEWLPESFLVLC